MEPQNNSSSIKILRCPNCFGTVNFVPGKGKVVCEFCGCEFDVDENSDENLIQGFDFREFYDGVKQDDCENLPIYYCKSCGAEIIAANEEASLTCPYCTNKIVLSNKVSGKFRPDGIIPFKIPQSELKRHLDEFYKDKKLLPKNFFSQSKLEKVTGIYVPFWLFSGTLEGTFTFSGNKSKSSIQGDYTITETSTYDIERQGYVTFEDIPLDASEKIDDALMDSVLPYDFSKIKNFNYQYLAGFAADRFDVPGKSLQKRAEDRMIQTASKISYAKVSSGYSNVRMKKSNLKATDVKVKYILLPVYLFSIKYGGNKYEFSINGQNGKVVGNLPIDKNVCWIYRLKKAIIPAAIVALYYILSYFIGWRI